MSVRDSLVFTEMKITRLSAGTVYKLVAIGLACSLLPVCLLLGVLSVFGAQTITWNREHLTGLRGLAMSPVVALMLAGFGTLFLGSACALGLWLFSFIRPIRILVKDVAQRADGN